MNFEDSREILSKEWNHVQQQAEEDAAYDYLGDATLRQSIREGINHNYVCYRFCLLVQILGKLTDPSIDCHSLQKGDGTDAKAWDARSLASKVIAPFNLQEESVLGSSADPYVSNTMRRPRMIRDQPQIRDIIGWNTLINVLDAVEERNSEEFTRSVFRQILLEFWRRQKTLTFEYPVPHRVSLSGAIQCCEQYLAKKSGGERGLVLTGALFEVAGKHFGLYDRVKRGVINTADAASDASGDLECIDSDGKLVMTVEVKERSLTLADVKGTIAKARNNQVREVFFTSPKISKSEQDEVSSRTESEFASGLNLYVFKFEDLARAILALGGERIRHEFLIAVGQQLDTHNTQPHHRKAWKDILVSL